MLQIPFFGDTLETIMQLFMNNMTVALVLILSGGLLAIWLLENITDPIPLLGSIFDLLVHVGTFLGFFVGILDIFVGYVVWVAVPGATIVAAVLIIMGFSLVMRVLSKFPLALVFAAGLAIFVAATVYGFVAPYVGSTYYNAVPQVAQIVDFVISGTGLLLIGFIVFCVAYVIGGFILGLIGLIGKIFASRPVSVIIGLVGMAVGVVVILLPELLGMPIVIPWP